MNAEAAIAEIKAADIDVYVGKRVKDRRVFLGISQGALGNQLGLTFAQIQKYENGSNRISAGRLYLISRCLQVPVRFFFDGVETQ